MRRSPLDSMSSILCALGGGSPVAATAGGYACAGIPAGTGSPGAECIAARIAGRSPLEGRDPAEGGGPFAGIVVLDKESPIAGGLKDGPDSGMGVKLPASRASRAKTMQHGIDAVRIANNVGAESGGACKRVEAEFPGWMWIPSLAGADSSKRHRSGGGAGQGGRCAGRK